MLDFFIYKQGRKRARKLVELTKQDGLLPGAPKWDGTAATHCNEYVYEAAILCGYNPKPLLNPKGIGWTGAQDMYRNGREAKVEGVLKELSARKAQEVVNRGRFVVVLAYNLYNGSGHVAIVQRFIGLYPPNKGCRIVQAGEKNGEFWLNDIFNLTILSAPMFLELKEI